ncbi:histidine kinase [Aeromicrobium sp. PE09-221]|uniref:histidine kinase n=1 Tax=Aeromicrobium sp. PE09-221 TaxID=1898043 RepID=UPI000B3ED7B9|nr:histidine kinase [Aeromicrobium sp. PE09-221]OUZ12386.1 histidine kinase [Aeromicrobium sp. PE09-221]
MEQAELQAMRVRAMRAWTSFVEQGDAAEDLVRPEILSSWRRSERAAVDRIGEAPLSDEGEALAYWRESPLQAAVERIEAELRRTAEDGDLVVAITDPESRILWTYGGRVMRRKAESVNFVPAGRWDDSSVGTNALDLANRLGAPSMVFSAEHYAPMVHNWVCWAAPVHDPVTGEQLGVIDLSTTWDRTHPIGLATARVLARLVESALPVRGAPAAADEPELGEPGLDLTLLGAVAVRLDGTRLLLSRRQTEILALLALHPDGLSLDQLHALLYGDAAVTLSTLKVEVSHLRSALAGQLASRPYRLMMPVQTDVETVLDLLRAGRVSEAVHAYGGDLMPGTDSPVLMELGEVVAVAIREALLADPNPVAVVRYSELVPHDGEVIEAGLRAMGSAPHPSRALLKARLAVARSRHPR